MHITTIDNFEDIQNIASTLRSLNKATMQQSAINTMKEEMRRMMMPQIPSTFPIAGEQTREERIADFNKKADEFANIDRCANGSKVFQWSSNFIQKISSDMPVSLSSYRCISLADLEAGKTYRGCIVYFQIVTRLMPATSAMVLVEDDSALLDLAVYGSFDRNNLKKGSTIAIKEPFCKLRNDGSKGIRVDDPTDIIFNAKKSGESPPVKDEIIPKRGTVQERLEELVLEDNEKGVDKLYRQLANEGYSISKKRVRALKKVVLGGSKKISSSASNNDSIKIPIIPIISERRPEKHRVYQVAKVLECKEAGNEALLSKSYAKAEGLYSEALEHKDGPTDNSVEEVSLW